MRGLAEVPQQKWVVRVGAVDHDVVSVEAYEDIVVAAAGDASVSNGVIPSGNLTQKFLFGKRVKLNCEFLHTRYYVFIYKHHLSAFL